MFSWFGGRLDFGMLRDARSTICYRATRISPWRASAHSNSTRHQQAPQHHLRPQGGFGQLWDYGRGTSSTTGEPALNGSALAPERFADIIATGTASPPIANRKTKVSVGFVEDLNNKIRVFQRRGYGLRDDECLRLKVLTLHAAAAMPPKKSPTRFTEHKIYRPV